MRRRTKGPIIPRDLPAALTPADVADMARQNGTTAQVVA
jgi:hypothetical protein